MTEAEWLACGEPKAMVAFVRRAASDRRLRLFACACCRALWPLLTDSDRRGVDAAERYADGLAGPAERDAARSARQVGRLPAASRAAGAATFASGFAAGSMGSDHAAEAGLAGPEQCRLLRCIFNPFHPVTLDPAWPTSTAVSLARGMYESREFSAMPILADALQDAGCDSDHILNHCRDDGPHVHGCWVVDLVLSRQ